MDRRVSEGVVFATSEADMRFFDASLGLTVAATLVCVPWVAEWVPTGAAHARV